MSLLQGISPWWWVALAILLAAVEMVTITTVMVWSALAAFVTALTLWAAPGMGGFQQIGLFGVLSIVFFFVGRWAVDRFGQPGGGDSRLNERAQALVGRDAEVMSFSFAEGKVVVDGVPWPARLEPGALPPSAGDRVRIVAADGITVRVRPVPRDEAATDGF
jgi:membrane protein implicated in regulation of membrane protease activity